MTQDARASSPRARRPKRGADSSEPTPPQIRAAREQVDLSQKAAGALVGRGWRVWAAYEAGKHRIDPLLWLVWRIRAGLLPPEAILGMSRD